MVGIKKDSSVFRKGIRNGISSMYNIRCNPELGVGKADVRRIPCACSFCIEQLDLPQDKNEKDTSQKWYSTKNSLNCNIFEGLNDWNIIILATQTKNENIKKDDEEFKTILRGVERIMNEKLQTTIYRSMRIDDEIIDGYYILQWISEPYTLQ